MSKGQRNQTSNWRTLLVLGGMGALLLGEHHRPLRRRVEPRASHTGRNLVYAILAFLTLKYLQKPLTGPLAQRVEHERIGLLPRLSLPPALETSLALLLLDYTIYLWHVLLHKVPLLWRFHLVHHVDLDLDASTALRFHAGELLLSIPFRLAQIRLIGVRPAQLALWQSWFFASVLFHHANLRLPFRLERWLNFLLVTPRMHGIHHSTVADETGSNFSSGLSLWDRLHGSLRLNVPQDQISIGVPAYRQADELGLGQSLTMPFRPERTAFAAAPRRNRPGPARRLLP